MLLNTPRIPWVSLRGAVTQDDVALSAFDFSDWPSSNTIKLSDPPLHDANGILIAFHGSNAANEDATYKLYGRARSTGMVELLLEGKITLGTQNCTTDPFTGATITNGEWADTITATGGLFSGLVEIFDSGNDRICVIKFDTMHIEELYIEFDLDGGSVTATSMYAMITGY